MAAPAAAGESLRLRAFASRRDWAPLDGAGLSAPDAEALGVGRHGRILVEVGGAHLALLAAADPAVLPGHLLLPPWLGSVLGVPDGASAEVSPGARGAAGAQDAPCRLRVEGPLLARAGPALGPLLVLSRPGLLAAARRQAARAGVRPVPGAAFAARVAGRVCAFRVVGVEEGGGGAAPGCAVCRPTGMGLVQALPPLAAGAPPGIDAAVATCLGLLDAPGLAAGGRRGAARVLCEGAPRAGSMPAFLGSLRGALGAASSGDVAHLPLGELIWELPEHGPAGGRTLRRLLAGFVESALAASSSSRLLVLWALDGPFPGSASAWLRDACGPLRSLPASCALLGLCASRARVPAALRELFDGGDRAAPEASQDLGLGPPPAAAAAVAGDEGERGSPPVVIGAGAALGDLRANVLNYYQHPGVFKAMGVAWPPRVLLHGPPGSGKTLVLQWLCAQVPARVRSTWLRPGEVWSRYLGESEERLRAAFAAAAEGAAAAGALLLLEGIDELVPGPCHGAAAQDAFRDRLAATLLVCLDGIDAPGGAAGGPGLGVVATSRAAAEALDPRITRPGRMDHWIPLGHLEEQERLLLLRHFVAAAAPGGAGAAGDLHPDPGPGERGALAALTAGCSAGELRLAATRAWADLPAGRSAPDWPCVLAALPAPGGAPARGRAAAAGARPAGPEELLEQAAALAVPSSDEEGL